jgi:hypothetical protein
LGVPITCILRKETLRAIPSPAAVGSEISMMRRNRLGQFPGAEPEGKIVMKKLYVTLARYAAERHSAARVGV